MGGRPAFPFEIIYANPNEYGEYAGLIEYWGAMFLGQKNEWVSFRRFQKQMRKTVEAFA